MQNSVGIFKAYRLSLLALFLFVVLGRPVYGQQTTLGGVAISADEMDRNLETKTVTLKGRVQIVFNGQYLSCDTAILNLKNKTIVAKGNIVLQDAKIYAKGDQLEYNYGDNTGTFYNGFVQSGQVVFQGLTVKKVGENKFIANDAYYTSCVTCPPDWSFTGSKIEAEIGGYAFIKYPILRIVGFPVLFLPAIIVPLKSTRQSGLLSPSFGYGNAVGLAFGQSYFWAISRSQDMTLGATHYEKKGLKGQLEYRYVFGPHSQGVLQGAFINDKNFFARRDDDASRIIRQKNRGFIKYAHYYELPNQMVHRTSVNYVNDLLYPRDFPEELEGNGDSALENEMSLTHNSNSQHLSVETAFYINLIKENPSDNNDDAVHRFPELRYSLMEQEIGNSNVFFRLDTNYVNFTRDSLSYDDICAPGETSSGCSGSTSYEVKDEKDARFTPFDNNGSGLDLIRTGQRIDLQPTLSYPISINRTLDVLPKVSYRELQYRFNPHDRATSSDYKNTAARRFIQAEVSAKTRFSKIFKSQNSETLYKHEIEPELSYITIPWSKRPNHVFFGNFEELDFTQQTIAVSDADFEDPNRRLQFDYKDRLFQQRLFNYGLVNRLIRKRIINGKPQYSNIMTFRLRQSFDFNEAQRSEKSQPWSVIQGDFNLNLDRFSFAQRVDYFPYNQISNLETRFRVRNALGSYFESWYNQTFTFDQDNNVEFAERSETLGLGLGWANRYFKIVGEVVQSLNYSKSEDGKRGGGTQRWAYLTEITPPGKCWGIQFRQSRPLGSENLVTTINFNFDFGGDF